MHRSHLVAVQGVACCMKYITQATSPHGPTYLFQSGGILTPQTNHSLPKKKAWLFITPATVQHILPCLIKSKSFTHQQDFLAGTRADMLLPRSPVASCQLSQNIYVNDASHATTTCADKSNENPMTSKRTKPSNGTVNNKAAPHRKIILFLVQEKKSPLCTIEASPFIPPTSAATFFTSNFQLHPQDGAYT